MPEWHEDAPGDIEVDEGIVDLIQALWDRGFYTIMSCDGGGVRGNAWIVFADEETARSFLRIATGTDQPTLGWTVGTPINGADTYVWFPAEAVPAACTAVRTSKIAPRLVKG
ncbi:MAG TPA: hypothetical protein VF990_13700 [Candidatus Dormibacteraeota bacterium]